MTEEQLAIIAGRGDSEAFGLLARRMGGLAQSVSSRYYGPGLDADDLFQAALEGLWRGCLTYDRAKLGAAPFTAYAAMCMHRYVITAVKASTRLKHRLHADAARLDAAAHVDEDGTLYDSVASAASDPVEALLLREQLETVIETVDGLTGLERESVVGLMNGETYLETEERLGIANDGRPKKVDNALQRARLKVLRALGEDVRRRPLVGGGA